MLKVKDLIKVLPGQIFIYEREELNECRRDWERVGYLKCGFCEFEGDKNHDCSNCKRYDRCLECEHLSECEGPITRFPPRTTPTFAGYAQDIPYKLLDRPIDSITAETIKKISYVSILLKL